MNLKYISFVVLSIITFSSCSDMLDIQKDGRVPYDKIFEDRDQTRAYLNSCFTNLGYFSPSFDLSSFCDETQNAEVSHSTVAAFSGWYSGQSTAQWFPVPSGYIWEGLFDGIRKCNVFIQNIDNAKIIATVNEKANWKSQALTLRALYYFQLIKRYGGVPIIKEPIKVGDDLSMYRRASFNDCVTTILKDCDDALAAPTAAFPLFNGSTNSGMMTKAVCYAIKSEAILYAVSPLWNDGTYSWNDALNITKQALDSINPNPSKPDYALYTKAPASSIAQNAYAAFHIIPPDVARQDKETIFQLGGRLQIWKFAGMPHMPDVISAGPNPTQDLVDAYEMKTGQAPILGYNDPDHLDPIINPLAGYDPQNPYKNRDPRFEASIYYNGSNQNLTGLAKYVQTYEGGLAGISQTDYRYTTTGYYVRKFNRWNSNKNNEADGVIRLYRYAELLLNYAEAAAYAVGPDVLVGDMTMTARGAVNVVRARAGIQAFPSGLSQEDFIAKYRNERRIEFAFEGHRYFDVRRWKIMKEVDKFVTGMKIIKNANNTLTYQRFRFDDRKVIDDKYYLFPLDVIEANKCFSTTGLIWQNPGW